MLYTIEQIAKLIGGKCFGPSSGRINWILVDSRSLCFPEETLFFALRTKRNDGHKYITELYERGVRAFVVSSLLGEDEMQRMADAAFLLVTDTLKSLQKLAALHRAQFDIPVVGITGSNGKTIVKEWLYQLLSGRERIVRSPRSYNSQVGVPCLFGC